METLHPEPEDLGERLDTWLSRYRGDHSRARWQALIRSGDVQVNGSKTKANHRLKEKDVVTFTIPPATPIDLEPENIPLDILYEDSDIIVIHKPSDLVVHPAAGHETGTLVHGLLYHCKDLAGVGGEERPGIVHRLDKDTSGVLVVAKNETAMRSLGEQFKGRDVEKIYFAIVYGHPSPESGTIETDIGRSQHDRKKMSATPPSGKPATTHYETKKKFKDAALVRVRIETGRTHQIRVHLAHIGHPVLGDSEYGGRRVQVPGAMAGRQMLHAASLKFQHPTDGKPMVFEAPIPKDMQAFLDALPQ